MHTVNYLRVVECEHDDAAKKNEGYGKGHQRDNMTMPINCYLYGIKEQ